MRARSNHVVSGTMPTGAPSALRRVAAVPHRFFFLAGVIQIALASIWWAWTIVGRAWPVVPALPAAVPDTALHALLMVCGFCPFFMFGFLFTAGPRWLGVAPPPPAAWLPAGLVALIAAAALPLTQLGAAALVRLAAGVYALAWLLLCTVFGRLLFASNAPDKVHASVVLCAMLVGATSVAAFAVLGSAAHGWVKVAGVWGFLAPVFVTVCHRMIPFFTASVVPFVAAFRPWWLLAMLVGAPVAHGALEALGLGGWTWLVDLPMAAVLLVLMWRWGLVQSLGNRLLAMLHLGFVWYGIAFALFAAHSLLVVYGRTGLGLAPLHALTIGCFSSLLMAMVTRVSCGHSGRILAADTLTWRLFLLLQIAAVVRVAAELFPGGGWLVLAVVLWCASVLPWCAKSRRCTGSSARICVRASEAAASLRGSPLGGETDASNAQMRKERRPGALRYCLGASV